MAHLAACRRPAQPRPGQAQRRRPALRRSGVDRVRHLGPGQGVVPRLHPPHAGHALRHSGAVEQGAPARRLLVAQVAQRGGAHQLPADQPARAEEVHRQPRREPDAGLAQHARRPAGRQRAHDRPGWLRGRRQPRHHARRGDLPQPPARGHPLRAHAAAGACRAGGHRHAVDQQVLHPRPQPEEEHGALPARPGPGRLHHELEEPGCLDARRALRRLPHRRHRRHRAGRTRIQRRGQGARRRLLHRRHRARHLDGVGGAALRR